MEKCDNRHTESLSPTSFRAALHAMRALRDFPSAVYDTIVSQRWDVNWERLTVENPALAEYIQQSQEENGGDIDLPLDVYEDMISKGLLVRVGIE
mgnify:CR=1 FL=1